MSTETYEQFKTKYLAHPDAEEAACDNETPERMEARCRRVWTHYHGGLDAAIARADAEECENDEREMSKTDRTQTEGRTASQMESVFHKLLEAAEEMNLPEGEYLHATALLKRCFETSKTTDTKRTTFAPETPIVLVLQGTSSQKDLTFTIQDVTLEMEPRQLPNGGTYNALIRTLRYTM